ncbi:hypothetical protein GYMLUDRAFT_875037 [Collybiopsis luxurians FD-317 M1]|nr:hypothetical protein GYMLUDRAFT_875037 [Collybiopsis luxurians FD-317 M1]
MPDISYAIDIINANLEEEKKLVLIFMDLRDETAAARRRLQEQYKRLQVEREHRERILSYLTYHVRNNNRWTGDLTTGEEPSEQASEQKKTNNGLGWKDMGQWEFGEIWSGPIVFTDQGEELAPSNTDEYVREVWNNFLRERDRAAESPVNDDEADAKSPTESTHAEPSLTTSKKRKAISDPSKPFQKRARALSPLSDSDIGPSDLGPFSTYVPPGRTMIWPSESKGKGKMSAKEVKQLEIQKSRIRGLDESDEEDRESTDSF